MGQTKTQIISDLKKIGSKNIFGPKNRNKNMKLSQIMAGIYIES